MRDARTILTAAALAMLIGLALAGLVTVHSFERMLLSTQPTYDDAAYIHQSAGSYRSGKAPLDIFTTRTPVFTLLSYGSYAVFGFERSANYLGLSVVAASFIFWIFHIFDYRIGPALFWSISPVLASKAFYPALIEFRPDWPSSLFLALFVLMFLRSIQARSRPAAAGIAALYFIALLTKTSFLPVCLVTLVFLVAVSVVSFLSVKGNAAAFRDNLVLLAICGIGGLLWLYLVMPFALEYIYSTLVTDKDVWARQSKGLIGDFLEYAQLGALYFVPHAMIAAGVLVLLAMRDPRNAERAVYAAFTVYIVYIYIALSMSMVKTHYIGFAIYVPCLLLLAYVGKWTSDVWGREQGIKRGLPMVLLASYTVLSLANFSRLPSHHPASAFRDYRQRVFEAVERTLQSVANPRLYIVSYSVIGCEQINSLRVFQRRPDAVCVGSWLDRDIGPVLSTVAKSNIVVTHTLNTPFENDHLPTSALRGEVMARLEADGGWEMELIPWKTTTEGMRIYVRARGP
jgi:hypothetical protein